MKTVNVKKLVLIFEMIKRFKAAARKQGFDNIEATVIEYSVGRKTIENGVPYTYPDTLEVKFENWENHFFSYRLQDGRFIPEGCDLSGKGLTLAQVYRKQLKELREFRRYLDNKGAVS